MDPVVAVRITMEAALVGAKIDPRTVPSGAFKMRFPQTPAGTIH